VTSILGTHGLLTRFSCVLQAYVEPAPGMMLNVVAGSSVRHDGLVTHDFFDRWNSSSSLQSCCETLAYAFGQVSPVVAAPAGYVPPPRPQQQQQQQQQQQPHRSPQTGGGGAAATSSSSWAPPAYPRDEGNKPVRTPSVDDPRIQEAMRASEQSAVLDNVSRKIRAKLGPRHRRATEVITKATARQSELARRTTELDGLRKRGETDTEQVRRAVQWYGAELPLLDLQVQEFEQHASDLESHERTVVATAPLYDQYISLLTKYNSIEDTLLTLKSVHNAANFTDESLKAVLNQIRDQSRKQFKALFMLQKVRTAAMIK
jgi:hypothetical protein